MEAINALLKAKADTEAKLAAVEFQLYNIETEYLKEMYTAGHEGPLVAKGLDSYLGIRTFGSSATSSASSSLAPLASSRRRAAPSSFGSSGVVREEERLLSQTSSTVSGSLALHRQLQGLGDEDEMDDSGSESDDSSGSSSGSDTAGSADPSSSGSEDEASSSSSDSDYGNSSGSRRRRQIRRKR